MQHFGWHTIKRGFTLATLMVFLFVSFAPAILHAGDVGIFDDLFDVSFPDETNGWACGRWGTVLYTSDGGKSWARQKSGTDFTLSSICFIDRKNGWAVGDRATIIHTSDGGKTWEKQEHPRFVVEETKLWEDGVVAAPKEKVTDQIFLMGVHFANARKGWIVAERTHILFTQDGGKTWQIQFKDEDFILRSVSFCDELNGWAVGEFGYIYHTNDGGKAWEHQAGEFDFSEETGEIIGGNFLFDVVAIDSQTAWVVGIDGYVAKSTDGGVSWLRITKGIPKVHLFGVTSDGEGRIIVAGDGISLVSSNSGATFQALHAEPSIKYGFFYGTAPRGEAGLVAVGSDGWIYLADKEMRLWRKVSGR